jgi:hypothetical protein
MIFLTGPSLPWNHTEIQQKYIRPTATPFEKHRPPPPKNKVWCLSSSLPDPPFPKVDFFPSFSKKGDFHQNGLFRYWAYTVI